MLAKLCKQSIDGLNTGCEFGGPDEWHPIIALAPREDTQKDYVGIGQLLSHEFQEVPNPVIESEETGSGNGPLRDTASFS